jgi:hypothetical protein
MMAVVPAWKLTELLSEGEILKHRQSIEAQVLRAQERDSPPTTAPSSSPIPSEKNGNPCQREDFTSLVQVKNVISATSFGSTQ